MTDVDPLDEGVPRGRYGRPLIIPANKAGKPNLKAKLVEYDRASTVADALDTGGGLAIWQTRHAALGIATNPDLAALAAALGRNLNTFTPEDKRNLDAIIERAHDRSGGNEKADYGTAVHSLTEPGNDGLIVIASMAGDIQSYGEALAEAGIEVDETETFVVNDTLQVAGTFDHSYLFTRDVTVKVNGEDVTISAGTKLIGDKKTGSLHFDAHAIQEAIYARGKRYDHTTGERTALDVSPQWGVVAHVAREGAETTLYLVNLADGWNGAKLAMQVREYTLGAKKRLSAPFVTVKIDGPPPATPAPAVEAAPVAEIVSTAEPIPEPVPDPVVEFVEVVMKPDETEAAVALLTDKLDAVEVPDPILSAINDAPDGDTCRALWSKHKREWTPEHTEAVKTHLAALQAAA